MYLYPIKDEMLLIHFLSLRLAHCFARHDLIDEPHIPHLAYKAEMLIGTLFFAAFLAALALFSGRWLPILSFSVPVYLLRRRMGGWHAPSPGLCQLMSAASVLLAVFLLGPRAERLPASAIFAAALSLDVFALLLRPAYPPQLHFSAEEAQANQARKTRLIVWLFLVQLLAFAAGALPIVLYSLLGLSFTVATVLLEKIILIKKGANP